MTTNYILGGLRQWEQQEQNERQKKKTAGIPAIAGKQATVEMPASKLATAKMRQQQARQQDQGRLQKRQANNSVQER